MKTRENKCRKDERNEFQRAEEEGRKEKVEVEAMVKEARGKKRGHTNFSSPFLLPTIFFFFLNSIFVALKKKSLFSRNI